VPCPQIQTGIALEVSWGALVETLVEAGFSVFSITQSNQTASATVTQPQARKMTLETHWSWPAPLRTDLKSFKCVQVDDPSTICLRELSRLDDQLKNEIHRTANQLWEQLRVANVFAKQYSIGQAATLCWIRAADSTTTNCARLATAIQAHCVESGIVCWRCVEQSCSPTNSSTPVYVEHSRRKNPGHHTKLFRLLGLEGYLAAVLSSMAIRGAMPQRGLYAQRASPE
jgi:hypothetical protein